MNKFRTLILSLLLFLAPVQIGALESAAQLIEQTNSALSEFSRENIDNHKKTIEKLVNQRKWKRRGLRILQAGATVLTIAELVIFGRDFLAALNGESSPRNEAKGRNTQENPQDQNQSPQKPKNEKIKIGLLLARAAIVAGAQTLTTYLIQRYYEQIMQTESISWYIFTHAFYKVNCKEIKQHVVALLDAKDQPTESYERQAVVSSLNALIKQLEKIVAFMEYKIERMPIKNRPEARSLTNHFINSATVFAESSQAILSNNAIPHILANLAKLESIIGRELLRFSRLEGTVSLNEQQYNALLQTQGT